MTNMKQEDIDRIIKYHLSPINISIHTANIELRKAMLKNRFAGKVFRYMDQLFDAGIEMNGQIVLCKGINDGVELNYTLDYLKKYIPHLSSLSIVPVGVSAHREGLTLLEPFTKEENNTIIAEVEKFRKNYLEKFQTRFVHLADEFYLNSDYPVPKDEAYEDYLQLENGVGMTRLFSDEFSKALRGKNNVRAKTISVVTGMLFYPTLRELVAKFNKKYPGTIVNVYPIQNDFFGHNITVTGLLTGRDIINQLNDKPLGEKLFLPKNLLKRDEPILLDDMSVEDMRRILNIAIEVVDVNGAELFARFKE